MQTSSNDPVLMSICTDASRCGGAVYTDSIVHLLADRRDRSDPYKGLDIIIQKVQPSIVIVSLVQKRLIDYMEKRFRFTTIDISKSKGNLNLTTPVLSGSSFNNLGTQNDSTLGTMNEGEILNIETNFQLVIVPNIWFSMSTGVQKLLESELVKSKGLTSPEEKSLFITSKVEKSTDVCAIRSISALENYITYIYAARQESEMLETSSSAQNYSQRVTTLDSQTYHQSNYGSEFANDPKNLMPIVDIKYIDPGPVLSIDKFSLESLGIFHRTHDQYNIELSGDDQIETIPSLYDFLNFCTSPQGKRQLRTIMMWPLQDLNELTHRHDAVEYLSNVENNLLRDQLAMQLKNVVPLSKVITKLHQSVGTYSEFVTIYKALWAFIAVMDLIKANEYNNLAIFDRIIELDTPQLRSVVESIINIVDFESSRREKRIQVCVGIDHNVDEKKEIVRNLAKFCDEVAVEETVKYRNTLAKICRVIYIPRIGFLNSIEYSSTSELLSMKMSKEFDVLLYTEQSVYFKTERMEQLDNNAGDIACDLIDVQEGVVMNLQDNLLKHSEAILKLTELCGELDCLVAFASVSSSRGWTRPIFTSFDDEIDIKQVYNPLYSLRQNMIPNDVKFYNRRSERRVKIMIITGPNSCGKTTYMKTVCLTVYMAHIGCFVPACLAKMPIVDAILTRMHSANSISTGLSSFATDVHQINYALQRATSRSLIAIDEFGKGTLASDGFHLLKGLVIYFAVRNLDSPYVMISTHFNRLINHLNNYSELILYKTFKVTKDPIQDSILYEFQVMDGVADISLADKVALIAGVPRSVIERAQQIRDFITANRQIRPLAPRGA